MSIFDWAKFRQTKGAIKLHLLLDHEGYLPVFATVSEGASHEIAVARSLDFPKGSIVVIDRGFIDYKLFAKWTDQGVYFVTRLKDNADFLAYDHRPVVQNGPIRRDQIGMLNAFVAGGWWRRELRVITLWDEQNQRQIRLLTNHLGFAASTIAAIYKERWQIEIFFKTLKQNLKIKTFVGSSSNAVRTQIWTALTIMANAEHIVQTTLVALTQGDFVGVVEQFHDQFIFIDHAIELEFTDKAQLIDFLTLSQALPGLKTSR